MTQTADHASIGGVDVTKHLTGIALSSHTHPAGQLATIFFRQEQLQAHLHGGVDPADFGSEEKSRYVKDQMLALMDELHEALAEIAWKPWSADKTKFNRSAYIRELIDAAHFLVNLAIAAGCDADEFFQVFMEKNDVNWNRHMKPGESYNASEGKCPCGRALDDYPGQNVKIKDVVYHSLDCETGKERAHAENVRLLLEG